MFLNYLHDNFDMNKIEMPVQLGAQCLNCSVYYHFENEASVVVDDVVRNNKSIFALFTPSELFEIEWEIYEGIEYE